MNAAELFTALALILTSAFLAGAEVALFSLSRFELRALKARHPDGHRKMKELLSDPGGLLLTILFATEVMNVSLSTIFASAILRSWHDVKDVVAPILKTVFGKDAPDWFLQLILVTASTAPIILLFSEMSPKVISTRLNRIVAPLTVGPLYWVYRMALPMRKMSQFLIGIFKRNPIEDRHVDQTEISTMQEDEFMFLVEEGHKEGKVKRTELDLVRNLFELDDTKAGEILTPMKDVITIPEGRILGDLIKSLRGKNLPSRLPVMDRTGKNVIGIVHAKDLLRAKADPNLATETVNTLMKKPLLVRSSVQLNTLFRRLKEQKTRIAIVANDRDEPVGIVTMNDLLYELFEDLFPENLERDGV